MHKNVHAGLAKKTYKSISGIDDNVPRQGLLMYYKKVNGVFQSIVALSTESYQSVDASVQSIFFLGATTLRTPSEALDLALDSAYLNVGTMVGSSAGIALYAANTATNILRRASKALHEDLTIFDDDLAWVMNTDKGTLNTLVGPMHTTSYVSPLVDANGDPAPHNYIPNSHAVGASVGVLPTGWRQLNPELLISIVGVGDGYIDVRVFGTATTAHALYFQPAVASSIVGQVWTASLKIEVLLGDPSSAYFYLRERTGLEVSQSVLVDGGQVITRTLSGASNTGIEVYLLFNNGVHDFTARILQPQLSKSATKLTYVPTYGTAVFAPTVHTGVERWENQIPNSHGVGAVAGNPGVVPNGWYNDGMGVRDGITKVVSAVGDGYEAFTLSGTATVDTYPLIFLSGWAELSFPASSPAFLSVNVELIAGELPPVPTWATGVTMADGAKTSAFWLQITQFNSASVYISGLNSNYIIDGYKFTTSIGVAKITPSIQFPIQAGQTVNFTIRISQPQLTQTAYKMPYMMTVGSPVNTAANWKNLLQAGADDFRNWGQNGPCVTTKDTLTVTGANGYLSAVTGAVVPIGTYTASIYIDEILAGNGVDCQIRHSAGTFVQLSSGSTSPGLKFATFTTTTVNQIVFYFGSAATAQVGDSVRASKAQVTQGVCIFPYTAPNTTVTKSCNKGVLTSGSWTNAIPAGSVDTAHDANISVATVGDITTVTEVGTSSVLRYFYKGAHAITSGLSYTASRKIKMVGRRYVQATFSSSFFGTSAYANYDLQNGVVAYNSAGTVASITPELDGYFTIRITATATSSGTGETAILVSIASGSAAWVASPAGINGVAYYCKHAMCTQSLYLYPYTPPGTTVPATSATTGGNGCNIPMTPGVVEWIPDDIELVTNGKFDSTANWNISMPAKQAITGGRLVYTTASDFRVSQSIPSLVTGAKYRFKFTISSISAGEVAAFLGGSFYSDGNTRWVNTVGDYSYDMVCGADTTDNAIYPSNFTGTIDNVSIQRLVDTIPDGIELVVNGTLDNDISQWASWGGAIQEWDTGKIAVSGGTDYVSFSRPPTIYLNVGTYNIKHTMHGSIPGQFALYVTQEFGAYDTVYGALDDSTTPVSENNNFVVTIPGIYSVRVFPWVVGALGGTVYADNISLQRRVPNYVRSKGDKILECMRGVTNGIELWATADSVGIGWTKISNTTYDALNVNNTSIYQTTLAVTGTRYLVKFYLARTSGSVSVYFGNGTQLIASSLSTAGWYEYEIVATTTGRLMFVGNNPFTGAISYVVCQQLQPSVFTAVVVCYMGAGGTELPNPTDANIFAVNNIKYHIRARRDTVSYPISATDGLAYRAIQQDWDGGEVHIKVIQPNSSGTQFKVGSLRLTPTFTPIEPMVWSDWTAYDGSMNPLTHLRLALLGVIPLGIIGAFLSNKSLTQQEIETRLSSCRII